MSIEKLEKQIRRHIADEYGEEWPLVAYVVYARVTDPETMTADSPFMVVPDGQRSFVTRGLLEEALTDFAAACAPVWSEVVWDDDDPDV